ncbi:hypothetical protein MRX96_041557 [Rhipicephalus microplus]
MRHSSLLLSSRTPRTLSHRGVYVRVQATLIWRSVRLRGPLVSAAAACRRLDRRPAAFLLPAPPLNLAAAGAVLGDHRRQVGGG